MFYSVVSGLNSFDRRPDAGVEGDMSKLHDLKARTRQVSQVFTRISSRDTGARHCAICPRVTVIEKPEKIFIVVYAEAKDDTGCPRFDKHCATPRLVAHRCNRGPDCPLIEYPYFLLGGDEE